MTTLTLSTSQLGIDARIPIRQDAPAASVRQHADGYSGAPEADCLASADGPGGTTGPQRIRNLRMMHLLERIAGRFNSAGVPLMVLKGAALNLTLYDRPDRRSMADLDLMIRPEDVDEAFALLEELSGLRGEPLVREDFFPRFHYEMEFAIGSIYPVKIDLHVRPFRPLRYARLLPPDAFWEAAEPRRIGRATVLIPSVEDMLIHLTVHMAIHGQPRDKWLRDIREWINTYEARIRWNRFLTTVEKWRLALPVQVGLDLAGRASDRLCPPEVRQRLSKMRITWRDRLALRQAPRDAAHPAAHVVVNALCTPGWRFVLSYLRAVVLPDRTHMADWYHARHPGWLPCAHVLRWVGPIVSWIPRQWRWFSKIEIQRSRIHGIGVFATRDIGCGEIIAHSHGKKVQREGIYVAWREDSTGQRQCYEITGELKYLNHSCHPCAELRDFALRAIRPIRTGEELTIEYKGATCTCGQKRWHRAPSHGGCAPGGAGLEVGDTGGHGRLPDPAVDQRGSRFGK